MIDPIPVGMKHKNIDGGHGHTAYLEEVDSNSEFEELPLGERNSLSAREQLMEYAYDPAYGTSHVQHWGFGPSKDRSGPPDRNNLLSPVVEAWDSEDSDLEEVDV